MSFHLGDQQPASSKKWRQGLDEKETRLGDVTGKEMKGELKLRDLELRQPLIDVIGWTPSQPIRGAHVEVGKRLLHELYS